MVYIIIKFVPRHGRLEDYSIFRRSSLINLTPNFTSNNVRQSFNTSKRDCSFEKSSGQPKQYNDPLMKWPIRGLAFTNDIGAAVMDIAPKLGTVLWYPAMMYFGADIYDKYRNNKESYEPNAKRGLEQAIFQALASVVFPIVAVHTGQKGASILARYGGNKLSLQTQEESTKFLSEFMSRRKLADYDNDITRFKSEFKASIDNYIDQTTRHHQNKNIVSKFFSLVFGGRHPEEMGKEGAGRRKLIHQYTEKKIDELFKIRAELVKDENKKPSLLSNKLYEEFKTLKAKYLKDPDLAKEAKDSAIKDILSKFEASSIFNTKMKKTIGGFVMLGLLIKPIDAFVEKVIMQKYVEPGLSFISNVQVKDFKQKNMDN